MWVRDLQHEVTMTHQPTRVIGAASVLALFAGACSFETSAAEEAGLSENVGVQRSELHKGQPGAIVGQSNYCDDPLQLCAAGEGDCDSSAGCQPGLVCGRGKSVQFGLTAGDACVPAHCTNKLHDADETQIDCGGTCGTTCAPPTCGPNGGAERCTTDCPCDVGEGDCDSNEECLTGLVCSRGKLIQYGLVAGDACVPAHCTNKLRDADETQIDCGGSCGTTCAPPTCAPNGGESDAAPIASAASAKVTAIRMTHASRAWSVAAANSASTSPPLVMLACPLIASITA